MWATVFKYIAQFLLIPLIKEGVAAWSEYRKTKREEKKLKEENKAKGEAYEKSDNANDARDKFNRLP